MFLLLVQHRLEKVLWLSIVENLAKEQIYNWEGTIIAIVTLLVFLWAVFCLWEARESWMADRQVEERAWGKEQSVDIASTMSEWAWKHLSWSLCFTFMLESPCFCHKILFGLSDDLKWLKQKREWRAVPSLQLCAEERAMMP